MFRELRRCARKQRFGDGRVVAGDRLVRRHVAHPRQRSKPQLVRAALDTVEARHAVQVDEAIGVSMLP